MCLPKAPKMPPPPAPPKIPQSPTEVNPSVLAARRNAKSQAASQSGFQSTILTGGRGVTSFSDTANVSLLGGRGASEASTVSRTNGQPKASNAVQKPQPVGGIDQEELKRRLAGLSILGKGTIGGGSGTKGGGSGTILGGSGTVGGGLSGFERIAAFKGRN